MFYDVLTLFTFIHLRILRESCGSQPFTRFFSFYFCNKKKKKQTLKNCEKYLPYNELGENKSNTHGLLSSIKLFIECTYIDKPLSKRLAERTF